MLCEDGIRLEPAFHCMLYLHPPLFCGRVRGKGGDPRELTF